MSTFWRHVNYKNIFLNLFVIFIYILSGKSGLSFAFLNPSATPIWLPTGIVLTVLLFFGYRVVPGIFLGAFILNNLTAGTTLTSLGIAIGNTLEGVIIAYFVKKFANGVHAFENVSNIFKFTFSAILGTMVSATIGVSTLVFGGFASALTFGSVWTTWWLGDMASAIIIAPLLLVWGDMSRINNINIKKILHFFVSFFFLYLVTQLVFTGILPYPYLCIPFGVWIAFRYGHKGATLSTIFVAAIAIYNTLHNQGPYVNQGSLNQSLTLVQLFLGTFSLTSLTFAAVVQVMKRDEKILTSNQKKFRALIENSFEAVVLIEASSKILYASPSVKKVLGYDPEELEGTTGFDLVIPEDRNKTMLLLAELALKPGGVVTTEYRTMKKDKSIIWVEATGKNLLFEPNIKAVVVNFRDITDRKNFEEKLQREKMQDEAMLTSIGEGIIATDNKGTITMVNQATCEILGWKEKDLLGKFIVDVIPMENKEGKTLNASERPITKLLSRGGSSALVSQSDYYIRKDKTKVPIRYTVTPIRIYENIVGTIEVFYDMTREREIDNAKNEFVSIASHQLRTPLTTINWYLELLLKDKLMDSGKRESYFNEVYRASYRMVALINSLLNVSRLELGTFTVEPKTVELSAVIDQTLNELLPQINAKGIQVEKNYQKEIPPILADQKLLSIIIQNLLSNAVKYNRRAGKIVIKLTSDDKKFLITIIDNGLGIPVQTQSKIFTKMFRADNARQYEPEGSGLGLYIVKKIIDITGGHISFSSEENKGTTFNVTFPISGMQKRAGEKQLS